MDIDADTGKSNRKELADSIYWIYKGETKAFHVMMKGAGQVHVAKTEFDRDMFIAQLKAKILCD